MKLFAHTALLAEGWARGVLIEIDARGYIERIRTELRACPPDAEEAQGVVLPGMPNLHSHAFQRALAGYCERRGPGEDSFWTWRRTMYAFVERITPRQVGDIAAQLYVEMLKAGYTAVGEFHYLHHDPAGRPYENLTEMSERVIGAAEDTGIAIAHLPVLYHFGGFGQEPPSRHQRRFVSHIELYAELVEQLLLRYRDRSDVRLGVAPHSLRAVNPPLLRAALDLIGRLDPSAPVHLHIAEQTGEVEECLTHRGARPVAWLLDNMPVDRRWCLVHATHMNEDETTRLARSGALAGLCPTTEANLGDGIFPAVEYMRAGGCFGIGSDSHVSVSPIEELRLLEYGQRLVHRRRALLAPGPDASVGAHLYRSAALGGARALGFAAGSLEVGHRADLVVLDPANPLLVDEPRDRLLDAVVFAGNRNPVNDVMVGGRWRVVGGRHPREAEILARFRSTQGQLTAEL